MNEFNILDAGAYALFAATWLGPFFLSALRRRVRLIHPNSCIPVPIVYLASVTLSFRVQGDFMLMTSRLYSADEWFLAGPMIFMSLMALCYHAGVWLSGLSPLCSERDSASNILKLPSFRRIPLFGTVFCVIIMYCLVVLVREMVWHWTEPGSTGQGDWMFQVFTRCFMFLWLFVAPLSSLWGTVFLAISFIMCLFYTSKVAFAYISLALLLFYQEKIVRYFKAGVALAVAGVLLIPITGSIYRRAAEGGYGVSGFQVVMSDEPLEKREWADVLDVILHREYTFESFAIVFEHSLVYPLRTGKETLVELSYFIPYFLWPEKPILRDYLPRQFLPFEISGWGNDCPGVTMYFLTPFLLDWGIGGSAIFMVILGSFFGYTYKVARDKSSKLGESWPMILYFPLPFMTHPFIGGGVAYAVTSVMGIGTGLVMTVILAKIFERVR